MSKPKNPSPACPKCYKDVLADGEKRLARAFRKWASTEAAFWDFVKIDNFLTTRAKRGKGR